MTKKNIFAYKLILSLNISEFNLFFMWKSPPTSWTPPPPAERGLHSMYIVYNISMQIAYYHYLHIIIISRTNRWNCLIFCSWYKFMKIKSWLKNFGVGMKKWVWVLCSRYPRLSQKWIDGINDFFACWHKFRKIVTSMIFWWASLKNGPGF